MNRQAKILACLLVAMAWACSLSSTAWAHAYLASADPPIGAVLALPPEQLKLTYSEAIEPKFSSFTLYDAQGNKLQEPIIDLQQGGLLVVLRLNPVQQGIYTLAWKVLSAIDGHLTKGTYPFSVGTEAGPTSPIETKAGEVTPSPARTIFRWLEFLSAMVLVGGLFFRLFVMRSADTSAFDHPSHPVFWVSFGVFILAGLSDLLLQAMTVSEASFVQLFQQGILVQLLFQTRYGLVWLARVGLALVLGVWMARRKSPDWAMAALSALLLLALALSSHSAALAQDAYLAIFADWGHLMAASFWVGGLIQFALMLPTLKRLAQEERAKVLKMLAPRFYQLAFIAAALLLLTGFHLTYRHIPDLGKVLWTTAYGQVYLIKHLLLLVLVLVAAGNLLWAWPRYAKTPARILRLEALFASAIVFFAGLLTLLPPADQAASNAAPQATSTSTPALLVRPAGGLTVALSVNPGTVGLDTFDVLLMNDEGLPVSDAQRVTLTFHYLDGDLGEVSTVAPSQGDGYYRAKGTYLSLPGQWEIGVTARFAGRAQDVRATMPFRLKGISKLAPPPLSPEDLAAIQAGQLIYQNTCMSCHGESGKGDGPLAKSLPEPPADLQQHLEHHTNEALVSIIKDGKVPVMPGFGNVLTDEQIQQLIRYLRALDKEK